MAAAVTSVGATNCPGLINNTATAQGDNTASASDHGEHHLSAAGAGDGQDAGQRHHHGGADGDLHHGGDQQRTGHRQQRGDQRSAAQRRDVDVDHGHAGCTITGSGAAQTLSCNAARWRKAQGSRGVAAAYRGRRHDLSGADEQHRDGDQGDNTAQASDTASITCQEPVLVVAKTPDSATITAGQTATFTVVVTNNGPGTANNVAISDPLPNGATLTWTTASAGCIDHRQRRSQALSCTVGTLAQGASFTAVASAATASALSGADDQHRDGSGRQHGAGERSGRRSPVTSRCW